MATLSMDSIRHQKPVYYVQFDGAVDDVVTMDWRPPNTSKFDWYDEPLFTAYDADYSLPTTLPTAATPAWTLVGVDHSTLSSGSHLEIGTAGTDQSSYGLNPAALVATDTVAMAATVKVDSGVVADAHGMTFVNQGKKVWVYVIDGAVRVQVPFGSSMTVWTGDTTSAYIELLGFLQADGKFYLYINSTGYRWRQIAQFEAVTNAGTYAVEFGKISTASENGSSYWQHAQVSVDERVRVFHDDATFLGMPPSYALTDFAMSTYDYDGSGVSGSTTHANGVVTISSCGQDQRYGSCSFTPTDDLTVLHVWGRGYVGSGFTGAKSAVLAAISAKYDVRAALTDGVVTAYDAGSSAGSESLTTTSEVRLDIWLDTTSGAYEVWADGTLIVSGTATAGTNATTGVFFGKYDDAGTDEDTAQVWRSVQYSLNPPSRVKTLSRGQRIHLGPGSDEYNQWRTLNASGAEFDCSGGTPALRVWLDDASDLSSFSVYLYSYDGGYYYYKKWVFSSLVDGYNILRLVDGEEDTHAYHASIPSPYWTPEAIERIWTRADFANTDETAFFVEHLYVEQPRTYSTGPLRDVAGLLSESVASFSETGGSLTGDYTEADEVAAGWAGYDSGDTRGMAFELDGTTLPSAASPAWTSNWGTAGGSLTSLVSGNVRIAGDGVNTEVWSSSFLSATSAINYDLTSIFVSAELTLDQALYSTNACNVRIYLRDYYLTVKIRPARIDVDAASGPDHVHYHDFTTATEFSLSMSNETGEWTLKIAGVPVLSATAPTYSGSIQPQVQFGHFQAESATQDWGYFAFHGLYSETSFSIVDDEELGGSAQQITVTDGGRTASLIHLTTANKWKLIPGRRYRLVAYVKATEDLVFYWNLYTTIPSPTSIATDFSRTITGGQDGYTRLEYPFEASSAGYNTTLYIYLGGGLLGGTNGSGTVQIGRVQIERELSTSLYEDYTNPDDTYTTFDEAASIRQGYVDKIRGSGQTVSPEAGTTSIPSLTFRLLDKDDEVLNLILENELQGSQVTLYRGYRDVCPEDYALTNIFRVDRTKLVNDGTAYEFSAPVELDRLKGTCLNSATDAATIVVGSADGTGLDNIVDVFMRLATTTSAGGNGAWDDGGGAGPLDGEGLGIDISRFDATAIANERDDWLSSWTVQYTFADRIKDLLRWAGTEVFALVGAYLYVTDEGLISIRRRRAPLFNEALETLDSSKILQASTTWQRSAAKGVYNRVTFEYNYDEAENEYTSRVSYDDARTVRTIKGIDYTSQELYGVKELTLKSQGVQSAISTTMLEARAAEVFARYAYAPPTLSAKVRSGVGWISPGDIFRLTDATPPNIKTGARGYSEVLVEVEKATPDFDSGTWSISFVDSGFARYRTGRISSIALDYTNGSVTDTQRNAYVWISSTDNLMGDGSDAYVIAQG